MSRQTLNESRHLFGHEKEFRVISRQSDMYTPDLLPFISLFIRHDMFEPEIEMLFT